MKSNFKIKITVRFVALVCFLALFAVACGKGKMFREDPKLQKYRDRTRAYLPDLKPGILKARLALVNRDMLPDLVLLRADEKGWPVIRVWNNQAGKRFVPVKRIGWQGQGSDRVAFMALRDLNHDGAEDLVLVGQFGGDSSAKVLFNNGKGYFYVRREIPFPYVNRGIDRVILRDIDGDGHVDMFFMGKRVLNDRGTPHRHQIQFMINNGRGQFKDSTQLLIPPLKPGIVEATLADYDGDKTLDIFLVNGDGQNSLLINNGLGQFADRTSELLPPINDRSAYADWADFDQDGDNDLLVVNREALAKGEYSYFLVNHGHGYFRKGPFKASPKVPFQAVYLLDANGSEFPDAILLSANGIHFLRGLGKWRFWKESRRRLPFNDKFHELTFADINRDGFLDIFGYAKREGRGVLWINTFE